MSETLADKLGQAGVRLTPQRLAICKLLDANYAHPTAIDIWKQVRKQYPSLSLMTVYNTLNVLMNLGAINVLGHAGDDTVHYDADTQPHVNLACVSCHKIVDIDSQYVSALNDEIGSASGYKLLGARVLFYGLCPACRGKEH